MRFILTIAAMAVAATAFAQTEALDDVNAIREANGLPLYQRDDGLTQAAARVAAFRAERFMFGHTQSDFAFLPPGVTADAAGCAAYPPDHGFMACAMYDDYQYAGAAYAIGADGKAYCHLFVRGGSGQRLGQRAIFNRPLRAHLIAKAQASPPAAKMPPPVPAATRVSVRMTVGEPRPVVAFFARHPVRSLVKTVLRPGCW